MPEMREPSRRLRNKIEVMMNDKMYETISDIADGGSLPQVCRDLITKGLRYEKIIQQKEQEIFDMPSILKAS